MLAWFLLGGKCARCKAPISFQYPAIEFLTAMLFLAVPLVYFHTDMQEGFLRAGLMGSWPILIVHLMLIASLIAATMIDIKHYIIPLGIPYVVIVLALIVYPVAVHLDSQFFHVVAYTGVGGVRIALGGLIGLILANVMLRLGWLPYSFADEEQWVEAIQKQQAQEQLQAQQTELETAGAASENSDNVTDAAGAISGTTSGGETAGASGGSGGDDGHHRTPIDMYLLYPHTRREMGKESLFLLVPLIGMILGYFFLPLGESVEGMLWLRALAGVILGYISGGAVIWLTRILGSYAFGKEAMGLGDVHLLAAIGAVLGPIDPLYVFFLAPFFGLLAAFISFGVARIYSGQARVIPYGPYLAGATVCVMFLHRILPT